MAPSRIEEAVSSLCNSDEYADILVKCGRHELNMHKAIVCPQSAWFKGKTSEGQNLLIKTVILDIDEDTGEALPAIKDFFYKGTYRGPGEHGDDYSDGSGVTTVVPAISAGAEDATLSLEASATASRRECAMLFHLDVFEIAHKIDCQALKDLALSKFRLAVELDWDGQYFVETVKKTCSIVRDGSGEEYLREAMVMVAAKHLPALLDLEHCEHLLELVDEESEFAKDLIIALADQSERDHSICKDCYLVWEPSLDLKEKNLRCPRLGCKGIKGIHSVAKKLSLSCKSSDCSFVFETVWWQTLSRVWCPACGWHGRIDQWLKSKEGA